MYKYYIFDFDGTLADSMPSWIDKMLNILNKAGVTEYPDDMIKTITTLGDAGTARYFIDRLGVKFTVDEMLEMMDDYALPLYRDKIVFKDGAADYLRKLKDNGCSVNLLTASPRKMVEPCMRRVGVWELFDNVWSTDDFGLPKSGTEIYHKACARLGVTTADAVFFDDNAGAIKAGVESGLYTVAVSDATDEPYKEVIKATCSRYIETFEELEII